MRDVVVVGAGPAGCAVAIHLARRGRSVMVVDRARSPERKACGEGLFPGGVEALRRLGVAAERCGGIALEGVRFVAGRAVAEAPFSGGNAASVRRGLLERELQTAAERQGVEFCSGVSVRGLATGNGRAIAVETTVGKIEARAFVAADGLGSRLRQAAALDSGRVGGRYGVSAHARTQDELEPMVQVWFGRGFEVYVTPLGSHEANVALLTRRDVMRSLAGDLAGGFSEVVRPHPALAGGFELLDTPLAAGPFPRGCTRAWRANVVLAGDAAGFFDGITGEGMSVALRGAERAARAVDAYLATGSYAPFRRYDRERRALTGNSDLLGRLSLGLARSPVVAELAVRNLGRRPETFARLVAVNTGAAGLRSLRPRDVAALLFHG